MSIHPPRSIVLPRTDPDLDGVACAISYAEYLLRQGIEASYWLPGNPDEEAEYVLRRFAIAKNASVPTSVSVVTRFVLVDASGLEGLPDEVSPSAIVEIIDHRLHGDPKRLFPSAHLQIEPVGAAATLVAEKFMTINSIPSASIVAALYGAIQSNTQCLLGSVTHQRDRDMSAWLLSTGNVPPDLLEGQFRAREEHIIADITGALKRERKTYEHSTGKYSVAQLELRGAAALLASNEKTFLLELHNSEIRLVINLVDSTNGTCTLLIDDEELKRLVEQSLRVQFSGWKCYINPSVLRKQLVAALEHSK